jgi:hypothetical protein
MAGAAKERLLANMTTAMIHESPLFCVAESFEREEIGRNEIEKNDIKIRLV